MLLRIHRPTFPLDGFVESLIYYEGVVTAHALERFLPDGNTEFIISLSEEPQFIHHNVSLNVLQSCRRSWVSGVRTQPITIPSGVGNRMLVVAFKKGGGHPFYPFPMNEIMDTVVDADQIFGSEVLFLWEQLLHASSIDEMFLLVESFLLKKAGDRMHARVETGCVKHAVDHILSQPSETRLQTLVEQIGYSQKHFIGLFKRSVGLPPKQYMRILRFQQAIRRMEKNGSPCDWTELALQTGFYDQAHFINDFRNFSGFSPTEYLRLKSNTLNYVPVV